MRHMCRMKWDYQEENGHSLQYIYILRDQPTINLAARVICVRYVTSLQGTAVAAPVVDLLSELFGWLVCWFTKQSCKLVVHVDFVPL